MATIDTVFASEDLVAIVLSHVEDDDIQQTILALSRVFPRYYFPFHALLRRIVLRRPEQCVQLHRRLRGPHPDANLVRELRIQSWTADAEVVCNLLDVLEGLKVLALYVGANFVPEILLRVMEKPRASLETLMIRFRP